MSAETLAAAIAANPEYEGSSSLEVGAIVKPDGTVVPLQSDANGNLLTSSAGAAGPATSVQGQLKVATTGTAVQLPSHAITQGVAISAKATNAADILVGGSAVTNTDDGTGNGVVLSPGSSLSINVANTNALYINGTAGDSVSYIGS